MPGLPEPKGEPFYFYSYSILKGKPESGPKPEPKELSPEERENGQTPPLPFEFDEETEKIDGQERKVKMTTGGLFVFGEDEVFEKPDPDDSEPPKPTGVWVGVPKTGIRAGQLIEPAKTTLPYVKFYC